MLYVLPALVIAISINYRGKRYQPLREMSTKSTGCASLRIQIRQYCKCTARSLVFAVSGESFSIGPHPLREYQSYADVDLTAYQINGLQLDATWTFGLMRSHAHCPNKNATMYVN